MSKIVVYVSGSSGVGKNTIINHVTEKMDNVKFLVSYTTRTKREFEEVDKQYHFVGKDEFKKLILEVCEKGDELALKNFGKFRLEEKKARKFLNPQTKRYYFSKPKKVINFKAYKNFKYAIK